MQGPRQPSRAWFLVGLFLATLVTLCLEVLNTRLLSVVAWYHLSFFGVSTAMFGMSAGALHVYLGGEAFSVARAPEKLARYALALTLAIPLCHLAQLTILVPTGISAQAVAALLTTTLLLAIPFYLAGVIVAIALTRTPVPIGIAYAVDLVGASLGCLLVIPLLEWSNLSTAVLVCAALAALATFCFSAYASSLASESGAVGRPRLVHLLLCGLLLAGAFANARRGALTVWYSKGLETASQTDVAEYWNLHSQIRVQDEQQDQPPFYWGPGKGAREHTVTKRNLIIDGHALTVMTEWDGRADSLAWVAHDVTSLPYHLRRGGSAAVIGVGGGRDLLTALWAGCERVVGVEINEVFLDLLTGRRLNDLPPEYAGGSLRAFARLADDPRVTLVHDEARSYLTRTDERFDVLQMSLIDTFAASSAGAFTLTENGLYTAQAWDVFLDVLAPGGLFSVSRWHGREDALETGRMLALAVSTLLEREQLGAAGLSAEPRDYLALVSCRNVATLLLSNEPLTEADLATLASAEDEFGYRVLVAPDVEPENELLLGIASARTPAELARAIEHPIFDFSPPTDDQPFFFNMLKPSHAFLAGASDMKNSAEWGIIVGNLVASGTLLLLCAISAVLVLVVILVPLLARGLPPMDGPSFAAAIGYFAAIGLGFMLVQIPFMQRFSVYLGHPTYSIVVILFTMILAAGIGSFASEKLDFAARPGLLRVYPLAIALALGAIALGVQPIIDATIEWSLPVRCGVVLALVAPLSVLLGLCFPVGMRIVERHTSEALPWMWGVNGACGVLGAALAVAVSMWFGIGANFYAAIALYASLAWFGPACFRRS